MAATPNSSATAYAATSDLTLYHDWRTIADLISDDDDRAASKAVVEADDVVEAFMELASGELEAACFVGNRYTAADLAALTGVSLRYLKKLISDLAFFRLMERRWPGVQAANVAGASGALSALEMLKQGSRIFSFEETADAGLMDNVDVRPAGSIQERDRLSVQADRFFGVRTK